MSDNDFFLYDVSYMERIDLFDGIVFGRDQTCDVVIDDEMVSGTHFKIEIVDNQTFIIDMESSNKTMVNNVELVPYQKTILKPKDFIKVGSQEYSFSNRDSKELSVPELSSSLELNRFNDKIPPTPDEEDLSSSLELLPNVEMCLPKQKGEAGLKELREAKKSIEDLEATAQESNEKIADLKKIRRRKIEVGAKIDQMKKVLESSDYKIEKDFEKEIRLHRGTMEGLRMKLQKEQKEIAQAQKTIKEAEAVISQSMFNIANLESESSQSKNKLDAVSGEFDIFKNKGSFENEFGKLKESIKKYEFLNLDERKEDVIKEIKEKTKELKEMQNYYGAKINSEIQLKKASSE